MTPEKFSLQALFKRIWKSDNMGTYEKFLIKEHTSMQKKKYVRQKKKSYYSNQFGPEM